MSASLLESLSGLVTPDLINKAAAAFGDHPDAVTKGISAALPMLLGSMAQRASEPSFASTLFNLVSDRANDGSLLGNVASLFGSNAASLPMMAVGGKLLSSLFGSNTSAVGNALANYAGVKPSTASSMLSMGAPLVLSLLGKSARSGNLNASSLASLLLGQKQSFAAALPAGLSKLEGFLAAPAAAAYAAPPAPEPKSGFAKWIIPLLLALATLFLLSRCFGHKETATVAPPPAAETTPAVQAPPAAEPAPAPEAAAATTPTAKLFFDVGKADLPADASAALAPVVSYLQSNAAATAVVSGFHDPTGDQAVNEELAKNRAGAVKAALVAAGVAEGRIDMQKPVVTEGGGSLEDARRVEVSVR
jgi:outer membrane protein OmpA-like peptidoglycan-associated protein